MSHVSPIDFSGSTLNMNQFDPTLYKFMQKHYQSTLLLKIRATIEASMVYLRLPNSNLAMVAFELGDIPVCAFIHNVALTLCVLEAEKPPEMFWNAFFLFC